MPLASGGSGRLDRLYLPAGAVKPPFRVCGQQSAISGQQDKEKALLKADG